MSTYETCLRIEGVLQRASGNGKQIRNDLVYLRILGYLLHYALSHQGLLRVITEITWAGNDDGAIFQVGRMYHDHLVSFSVYSFIYMASDVVS